jgi:hypothetical protein
LETRRDSVDPPTRSLAALDMRRTAGVGLGQSAAAPWP